jgi:hypothetical protein
MLIVCVSRDNETVIEPRSFSCSSLAYGLNTADCNYMSTIGMAGQGTNARSNNGQIWIGSDGPNTFTFTNQATSPSAVSVMQAGFYSRKSGSMANKMSRLILWYQAPGDGEASFMNVRKPMVSYSLPSVGNSVTISVANGISGAWAALNNHATVLSQYGQIYNTWGEFTTGNSATVDISREVNMGGNYMSLVVSTGCVANMNTCAFQCYSGNTCGASGTYELVNCAAGSQTGATTGYYNGNPAGGCQGWSNGGHIDIALKRY